MPTKKRKERSTRFLFLYTDKEDNSFATHSLTCHGLVRIFSIPSFIFFSFHVRNLANNKVLFSYDKKGKERKPSAFHSTLLQEREKICDVLKSLDLLRSFGCYVVLALQCFASVHISKRKKHCRAIRSKTLQGHCKTKRPKYLKRYDLFFSNFVFASAEYLLKSVHFKKTVARSSFLSKLWYLLLLY